MVDFPGRYEGLSIAFTLRNEICESPMILKERILNERPEQPPISDA
jgi:hypothetical protein